MFKFKSPWLWSRNATWCEFNQKRCELKNFLYILFDFVQDVHIQDLVDIVSTNSIIHVNEGSGVVNDNVHHSNFVVDQQRFGVAIANDLGLEKPHVDFIGVFQKKMMV
jgi:hypothetical protein